MDYSWNLVKGDIERLEFLFFSLSRILGEQEIIMSRGCVTYYTEILPLSRLLEIEREEYLFRVLGKQKIYLELWKKSAESKKLLRTLAEMVINFEKRYKVDDEEKQDEGGALDDEEKHERIVLELWLEELQEAVFNTEDLVEKICTEALRHKLDGQVSEKMEDICCSLESYVKAGHVLGLAGEMRYQQQGQGQPLDPTDYTYFVDESEVFSMDCHKEEIIKLLLSDDANDRRCSVISIVGNGRIEKTTLARLVYNEQRVSIHFDRKAWVDVPDDFNWVTKSILKSLSWGYMDLKQKYNDLNKLELDQLVFELRNYFKGKRFLLVLDGAKQTPSPKGWEALRYALKDAANGSCIIVTTRNKDIAPMMDAGSTYRMEPLSEEKCWTIFAKFAFGDQNPTSDTHLEVVGKEIVQMCHGLPSSVGILGFLLRFKLQQEEWEAILKRLKPSSDSRENVNGVPNSRLPEYLKRCLAYCSIFPSDYEFDMEKLVLLCMAEGFLKRYTTVKWASNKLMPFFRKSSRNESSFRMCRNNLEDNVSTRYCFRLEDNHPSQIPLNTRYLSLVGGKYENSVIFEAIDRAKLLRTLLPFDHESRHLCATELQNLLSKLQFLRVLSLSHYHITEIPDSIGNLEHLRYIDLSHTPIKRLPESVCELFNLQSLILSNCHFLTELPENTSKLVNLLNLDISGSGLSEMPTGMSKLKNLKLLPCFVVGKRSGFVLGELCLIKLEGTIHISKLQNVASEDDALGASLWRKRLHELVLEWDEDSADPKNATEVLGGLRPNETCLAKLTINFYNGTQFAKWFKWWKFDHLFFLRLSNCKNCSTLPSLSNLPSIRVLIIECMDAVEEVGPDFSAETSTSTKTEFKSLEILTFEGMSKWTKWAPSNVLPCLKQLCIRRCPKLRGNLPKELPSVERVEISESQELVTPQTKETSWKILHYFKKIVFISDDKVTSFSSERAIGSSSIMIKGKVTKKPKEIEEREEIKEEIEAEIQTTSKTNWSKHEQKESTEDPSQFPFSKEKSALPLTQHVAECSSLVTPGTEERGDSEQETHLKVETAPETKESKLEQEEYTKEDSSSLFLEEKSLLPPTQDASESSLPQPQASPKSLLPMTHNVVESSLPLPQDVAECSSLVTPGRAPLPIVTKKLNETLGTEESGDSEQETHLEAETTSETKESKLEQKEYTKEDPSSLISEEKSLFNPTQDASISSLPQSQAFLKSFLPMTHDVVESSLPLPQHAIECSSLVTQGTEERGDSEQETRLEVETASKTKESKLEQEEYTKEDLSSLFSEEKSLLPSTQDALESSLPQPQASPKSLLPITHDVESSLPLPQHAVECSWLVTPGTEERGDSEQETHLEAETVSETNESKLEQEEYTKEDPSSRILEEKSLLPPTQGASESSLSQPQDSAKSLLPTTEDAVETSLPVSQTPNFKEKPDDSTNTWSNTDGPQYLSFKSMKVSGVLQLIELPGGLHSLRIEGCDALEDIPEGIMAGLNLLQHLYIINCCSLNSFPEDHPPTTLKKLYIQNCKKLEIFSPTKRTHQYERLEHLCIGSSDSLISLPLDFFPKLKSISIWDCANLQSLSMPVKNQKDLTSLEALEIRDCPKLEYFLNGGLSAPNLMSIWLSNCENLKELPDQLDTLINSLRSLFINNCPELVSLPKLPSSLSLLSITFCYKLELVMDWGLHSLWNLSRLEIEGGCKNVESFPEKGLLPNNLNSLCISGLLNLKYLKCEELQHLTSLKTLEISCCNKLQPFPEEDLPFSLSLLCIKECSLLKPKILKKRKMFD